MSARELLRAAAELIECVWGTECREAGCKAHGTAAALRALADRIDEEFTASRDVRMGNNAVRRILLARLDADLDAPLQKEPR